MKFVTCKTLDEAAALLTDASDETPVPKCQQMRNMTDPHVFTIGIEEEFQIIDPETRGLRSRIGQILEDGKITLKERVKAEMHQSVVELGTEICSDVRCARADVVRLRTELAKLAARRGLLIASAGTHPFSHWITQLITADDRYATIVKDLQQIARANLIFRPARAHWNSGSRGGHPVDESGALFPATHLCAFGQLALSGWAENTGFKAYRHNIFERFPRTGIPDPFESLSEYEDYLKLIDRNQLHR